MTTEATEPKETAETGDQNERPVIIPRDEILKLESARADLWDICDKHGFNAMQMAELESVTSVMYRLANTKWPEYEA